MGKVSRVVRVRDRRVGDYRSTIVFLVPGDLRRDEIPEGDIAECGSCGRKWDDGQSTGVTPSPSGRCPFEYEHA